MQEKWVIVRVTAVVIYCLCGGATGSPMGVCIRVPYPCIHDIWHSSQPVFAVAALSISTAFFSHLFGKNVIFTLFFGVIFRSFLGTLRGDFYKIIRYQIRGNQKKWLYCTQGGDGPFDNRATFSRFLEFYMV